MPVNQPMKKQFSLIFFGLIFVLLDPVFGGYDIIPDVLGYILIGIGTSGLQSYSIHFGTARNLSWALAVFSVALLFIMGMGQLFFFSDLVVRVIDIGLIWFLLGGIRELAQSKSREDLAKNASQLRMLFVILAVSTAVGVVVFKNNPAADETFQLLVQLAIIVILVLIFILIHRCKKHLTEEPILGPSDSASTPKPSDT